MTTGRLMVIGGDAAGMSAASKVRRQKPEREIVVFERSPHTSYSACGMPYFIAGLIDSADKLVARSPEKFREKFNIDVRVQHEVLELDPTAQRVRVKDLISNNEAWEPYDQLLITTGAQAIFPQLEDSNADGIFSLSTLASGIKVYEFMDKHLPRKAVVVGGGYIGLEMAEALVRQGLQVSLIEKGEQVMGTLDPDIGQLVSEALREIGVTLYLHESLTGYEQSNGMVTGVVTDQRTIPADLVIVGLGTRPNTGLAKDAGILLGEKGSIRVNPRQQTSAPNIWAAGDCAESFHLVSRKPFHVALGTVANKQGTVAGTNLAGGYATFPGVVGTAVSKICKYEVARTGLMEREITGLGLQYKTATTKTKTRAGYYPGAGWIMVKLLAELGTGRLLGGQIVGLEGAAKRIDVLATALTAGMTVQQIVDLDLSYAPPFSPVWDPVQTAARQLLG
ncbi:MAG: FAD-dependent oxidoreductase [Trichlorobacter sp.]|uniref:FAD-dependent oxidoreductase n=1 Tax=Trichlorobacter sp. TaxID=2911007 RepID=UPI00256978A3|nr:FAD-dependent oxidoreductase [Trichlorobacter sp.]MDK9718499.1 FAD-dependent oxidoreductase [Trichlorobacter sp.]